jgi:lysylphosphatidylglycerol synthetase-like protein (DUF2156 family)
MSDPWFGPEIPRSLAFLSLLSLLSIPAEQGRFRSAVTGVWVAALVFAGVLLVVAAAAFVLDQPAHVARTLTILGGVFGVSFGSTLPAVWRSYREAELRKVVAADL